MFIKDLKNDFYDVICRKHVLVVSNCDVDAVCTCKILQCLFRYDDVSYTLVPVAGITDFVRTIYEYSGQVKHVLLINCGANINLIELLEPPNDMIFYVIDSRRPFHLDNVFDSKQIRLVVKQNEFDDYKYPKYEEIFDDDEDDFDNPEDQVDSDNESRSPKAKRSRTEKESWMRKRNQIEFDYYEFSSHSTSSAVIVYDLAWKLSNDSNELLWCSAVGLTSQFLDNKINASKYKLDTIDVHQQVIRHNHNNKAYSADCLKLHSETDLSLVLYRHWSLLESLKHSPCTSCVFRTWTLKGMHKLYNFLAVLGIPLDQGRQKFNSLPSKFRKEIKETIEQNAEKYNLSELLFSSFGAQYTFVDKFSASDVSMAIAALLHFRDHSTNVDDNFLTALDSLSKHGTSLLYEGIELYKKFLGVLTAEVQTFLTTGLVIPSSVFLQCVLTQGSSGWRYFVNPCGLTIFGRYLCRAYAETRQGQKHKKKPLIIVVPSLADDGFVFVAGVPPYFVQNDGGKPVNILGNAFRRIADSTNCRMRASLFDTSVVELKSEDRHKFCDSLMSTIDV